VGDDKMPTGYSKKKNEQWRKEAELFDTRHQPSDAELEATFKQMYPNWKQIQKRNKEKQ